MKIEEFVSFKIANQLKDLGFKEPCMAAFSKTEEGIRFEFWNDENYEKWTKICSAPSYRQVFKWFREKHKLSHEIQHTYKGYYPLIYKNNVITAHWIGKVSKYEKSEISCIKQLIKILKEKS